MLHSYVACWFYAAYHCGCRFTPSIVVVVAIMGSQHVLVSCHVSCKMKVVSSFHVQTEPGGGMMFTSNAQVNRPRNRKKSIISKRLDFSIGESTNSLYSFIPAILLRGSPRASIHIYSSVSMTTAVTMMVPAMVMVPTMAIAIAIATTTAMAMDEESVVVLWFPLLM